VATSLRFRLSPLPEPVLSGTVTYPAAHADSLLRFYRDYTSDVREDVTTRLSLCGPAAAGVGHADATVSITAVSVGHPEDAERYVDPLRHAAPMLTDGLAPRPYARLHDGPGEAYPSGRYAAMTSGYLDELDAEVIEALCGAQAAMPPGSCELQLHHMGGAVGRVARMSTAVPNRAARFVVSALARWLRPHEEAENRDWLAAADKQIRQFALGGPYVGLQSEPASSVEVYGAERYLRLAALKRRYDPDNVFNGNQNVAPLA
jgi:FAD/FMN-containing dehydrogenase